MHLTITKVCAISNWYTARGTDKNGRVLIGSAKTAHGAIIKALKNIQ